jgi:hypothetical protein
VRSYQWHTTLETQNHDEKDDQANLRGAMNVVDFEGRSRWGRSEPFVER